ncbi:MAG: hypothetical protein HY875_13205 [Chloroflexi bacterium]|nr:hypothetical protein [Chloroflexota bacterium]
MKSWLTNAIANGEEGHVPVALPALVAGAGMITLGYAAADGSDRWMIIGGFAAGIGIIVGAFWRHRAIDWPIWKDLAGKK